MSNEKTTNLVGSPKLTRSSEARPSAAQRREPSKPDEFDRFEDLARKLAKAPKAKDK